VLPDFRYFLPFNTLSEVPTLWENPKQHPKTCSKPKPKVIAPRHGRQKKIGKTNLM
jgi:hypothetical protein